MADRCGWCGKSLPVGSWPVCADCPPKTEGWWCLVCEDWTDGEDTCENCGADVVRRSV